MPEAVHMESSPRHVHLLGGGALGGGSGVLSEAVTSLG